MVRVLWRPTVTDPLTLSDEIRVLRWMLERHPEIRARRAGLAAILSEIACWEAMRGRQQRARSAARAALRTCWYQPITFLALLACAGLVRGRLLLTVLRWRRLP